IARLLVVARGLEALAFHLLPRLVALLRASCIFAAESIASLASRLAIAVLLAAGLVAIGHAVAARSIVLPPAVAAAVATFASIAAIPFADLAIAAIDLAIELVVAAVVDVDVAAVPVAVAPDADRDADGRAPEHARAERIARVIGRRRVVVRRVVRIAPRAVDRVRIVGGHVHRVGLRGLEDRKS